MTTYPHRRLPSKRGHEKAAGRKLSTRLLGMGRTKPVLNLKDIKKQVARLSGLNFPPIMSEGWTELGKVLQRRCRTMDHVERIINSWLETEEDVPKPAQLGSLATDVPAAP